MGLQSLWRPILTLMKSLCRRHFFRLVSLWHFANFMGGGHTFRPKLRVVSCCSIRNPSRTLEAQLRRAQALTPELISDVTAEACVCFAARGGTAKQRINRLIDAGAWTDTALALLELELPQWTLRRIVYEDGEWHCSLSKQPQLPLGLDEVAEASHEILPLAILIALLQASRDG